MPSFDIVSKVDVQKLDNAINTAKKEISTRYDFHDSKTTIELDKKTMNVQVVTEHEMRMKAVEGIIIARLIKQGVDPSCLDFGTPQYASNNMVRKDVNIKQGIDKESARKVVKIVKESGMKLQASIMEDQVRVMGKKLDDLQKMISLIRAGNVGLPLQYENFRN